MKIDKKLIKELVDYLNEFNLTELEYGDSETKIKVSKNSSSNIINQEIKENTKTKIIKGTKKQAKGKSVALLSNIRDEYLVNLLKMRKKYENKIRK